MSGSFNLTPDDAIKIMSDMVGTCQAKLDDALSHIDDTEGGKAKVKAVMEQGRTAYCFTQ